MLSVEDAKSSFRNWLGWALSSEMEEHSNLIAKGTCPQIWVIRLQSEVLASGSNSCTRDLEDVSSSGLILTADWWNSRCKSRNPKDSLVVIANFTFWFRLRISSRNSTTSSRFTFGRPLSSKSSALSRMKTRSSDISLKSWQSSSSRDKCWAEKVFFEGCLKKLRSFEVKSAFDRSPRNESQKTGKPLDWISWPTAMATDVFPNPGEPHMDTIRVDSENKWPMISSHSFWRPVK